MNGVGDFERGNKTGRVGFANPLVGLHVGWPSASDSCLRQIDGHQSLDDVDVFTTP